MPKAISVHVGLNHVDHGAYGGWDGTLAGCINDAHDLAVIATSEGFRTSILVDRQATAGAVLSAVRAAASRLTAGDVFLLTFAGHGGQIEDVDDELAEPHGFDQTWACWDRQLLDDEMHAALAEFARDVRVIVVADSCHSGTVTRNAMSPSPPVRTPDGARRARMIPAAVARGDALRRHGTYIRARRNARAELRRAMARLRTLNRREAGLRKPTACLGARVVFLAGCQDNQVSYDGPGNGAFTAALLAVWNGGRFDGTYADLVSAIRARMTSQTPQYLAVGLGASAWEATRPFIVDITDDLEPIGVLDATELRATR
ncbi:MAG TPA: caspase family protein [Pseudonocardiaceae bacterium]